MTDLSIKTKLMIQALPTLASFLSDRSVKLGGPMLGDEDDVASQK